MGLSFAILDTGYLQTDINNVVAGTTMATRSNPDAKHRFYRLPVMCILIRHENGYILYDTGSNMNAMNGHWPINLQEAYELHQTVGQNLEVQLAMCGVRKEEIRTVVLSHMHFDHVGNIHLFTDAEVYAPKADFMYAQTLVHMTDDTTQYAGYSKKDLDVVVRRYTLVEGDMDFELVPDVRLINLPGHTPGLLGMMIHLESGWWLFPMDAVYTSEIYGPPAKASGLLYHREQYFASIEKVRCLQREYQARMIPAHDWDVFQSLQKAPIFYH